MLVSGPAGIGKSALLDEARRLATSPVLSARGSELEREYPFGAVQQLFAHVTVPREGAAAHAAAAFSLGGEPDHAVLHGLYWLTAGLGPLTIVVDDAHWLDRAVAALAGLHGQPRRRPAADARRSPRATTSPTNC